MTTAHPLAVHFDDVAKPVDTADAKEAPRWSPYINNGGTVMAVAGPDFVVAAGDTRLSQGFRIHSRNVSKILQLTEKVIICSAGMQAEVSTLHKLLKARIVFYEHQHRRPPGVKAVAQMLSTVLYYKRFFPYYTFNIIAGIDEEGKGAVYGYDAVGSFSREPYGVQGTGGHLIMSTLDAAVEQKNQTIKNAQSKVEVINTCKDCMAAAAERDIQTGDGAEIFVIDRSGVSRDEFPLKMD